MTTDKPKPTPRERLAAGEIVRFDELSTQELRDMFPRFADRWRAAMRDVAPVAAPETEAA
jgi:hypothetical protein